MRFSLRLVLLALTCLLLVQVAALAWRAGGGGVVTAVTPTIQGVVFLPNGTNFSTPAAPGSNVSALQATCVVGNCSGATFALSTTGTCSGAANNGSFAISGSNLNIGGSTVNAGSYSIGIAVTLPAATNNGTCFPYTIVGSGSTISGVTLSNGNNFTTPATTGTTIDTLVANCSSGSCAGATFALATTGSCSGAASNGSFAISGSNLNAGGGTVNAGTYTIGIAVTLSGASNSGTCYPFTIVGTTPVPTAVTFTTNPAPVSDTSASLTPIAGINVTMNTGGAFTGAGGGGLSLLTNTTTNAVALSSTSLPANITTRSGSPLTQADDCNFNTADCTAVVQACQNGTCVGGTLNMTIAVQSSDPTVGLLPAIRSDYPSWSTAGMQAIPFTASIANSGVMTVTASPSNALGPGQTVSGPGVSLGTQITGYGTGTGGPGTYTVNNPQIVASQAMTANGIPNRTTIFRTLTPLGGGQDDTPQIQNALDNCPPGQVIKLNAGVFLINGNGINNGAQSCTLRGTRPSNYAVAAGNTGNNGVIAGGNRTAGTYVADPLTTQLVKADHATNLNYEVMNLSPRGNFGPITGPPCGNTQGAVSYNLASDAVKGTKSLTLTGPPTVNVGDIVLVDMNTDNDPDVVYGYPFFQNTPAPPFCWPFYRPPDRSLAQLLEVTAVNGNVVTFDTPFHIAFTVSNTAQMTTFPFAFLRGAGVEDLFIWGGQNGDYHGNMPLVYCAYCWVKNVEAAWSEGTNIGFYGTFRSVLRDSYMHETPDANPGGGGYQSGINQAGSDNLFENNIMWYGNKEIVMRGSGGGNVIAYNYMDDAFGSTYPESPEAGVNAGHFTTPHMELLEGNYSQAFKGDSFWGNSIYITVFRNWLSGLRAAHAPLNTYTYVSGSCTYDYGDFQYRVASDIQAYSYYQSFVGNVLGLSGQATPAPAHPGCYTVVNGFVEQNWTSAQYNANIAAGAMWNIGDYTGSEVNAGGSCQCFSWIDTTINTQLRQGNWDWKTGAQHWYGIGGTTDGAGGPPVTIPASFYLTSKPAFFGTNPWPWVDPTSGVTNTLPAKFCFEHGQMPGCMQAAQSVASVALSCGGSCNFTAASTGVIGTASATLSPSSPTFNGTWSLKFTGTDHSGTTCDTHSTYYSISGNTISGTASSVAGTYNLCVVATGASLTNSPFVQAISVTATAQSVASTALSCGASCNFIAGSVGTIGTATATLNPTSPAFTGTWSLQFTGTDHSGTTCDTHSTFFTISGNTVSSTVSSTAGSYNLCVVATQAGLSNSPFVQAITVTGGSGGATPSMIQYISTGGNPAGSNQNGNNYTLPLAPTGAGDTLLLAFTAISGRTVVVTDSAGDTNTTAPGIGAAACSADAGANNNKSYIYVFQPTAGTTSVNVNFSGANFLPFQYVVAEFNNIATPTIQGSNCQAAIAAANTVVSPSNFTPTNNNGTGGNVIFNYTPLAKPASCLASTYTPAGGFTLLDGNAVWTPQGGGWGFFHSAQWLIQTTAAAVTPSVTMGGENCLAASAGDPFNSLTVALKIGSAGITAPSGIHVAKFAFVTNDGQNGPATPQTFHFPMPTVGNLRAFIFFGGNPSIQNATAVTSSDGCIFTKVDLTAGALWYAQNCSPCPTCTATISIPALGPTTIGSAAFFDVQNANAASFQNGLYGGGLTCTGQASIAHAPDFTPNNNSPGLALGFLSQGNGPGGGITGPSGAIYDFPTFAGQGDSDEMSQGDNMAHYYYSTNALQNWTWTISGVVGNSCFPLVAAFR